MHTPLPRIILRALRSEGEDVNSWVDRFGLPLSTEYDVIITASPELLHSFYEAAAHTLAVPCLGLHLAQRMDHGSYGLVEYCLRCAPTMREALRQLTRYFALISEPAIVTLTELPDGGRCELRVPGRVDGLGWLSNEVFVTYLLLQFRSISGRLCVPRQAWFAHPPPRSLAERHLYVRTLGTPHVEFGRPSTGFFFDTNTIDLPLRTHDPVLLAAVQRHMDRLLTEQPNEPDLLAQVREMIRQQVTNATLARVATAMHYSTRTLQRRLTEAGTSFQREVDHVREALARNYLAAERLSVHEVAQLLGYDDISAFRRAFKRWTGKSLRHYVPR